MGIGGRKNRHYDSSSSSSSSSDSSDNMVFTFPKKHQKPILSFSLNYYPSIYGVRNILLPSFIGSFTPFVKLNIPFVSSSVIITP